MNVKKLAKTAVLLILTICWLFWYLHYRDVLIFDYSTFNNSWWYPPILHYIIACESWMLFSLTMLTYCLIKLINEVIK